MTVRFLNFEYNLDVSGRCAPCCPDIECKPCSDVVGDFFNPLFSPKKVWIDIAGFVDAPGPTRQGGVDCSNSNGSFPLEFVGDFSYTYNPLLPLDGAPAFTLVDIKLRAVREFVIGGSISGAITAWNVLITTYCDGDFVPGTVYKYSCPVTSWNGCGSAVLNFESATFADGTVIRSRQSTVRLDVKPAPGENACQCQSVPASIVIRSNPGDPANCYCPCFLQCPSPGFKNPLYILITNANYIPLIFDPTGDSRRSGVFDTGYPTIMVPLEYGLSMPPSSYGGIRRGCLLWGTKTPDDQLPVDIPPDFVNASGIILINLPANLFGIDQRVVLQGAFSCINGKFGLLFFLIYQTDYNNFIGQIIPGRWYAHGLSIFSSEFIVGGTILDPVFDSTIECKGFCSAGGTVGSPGPFTLQDPPPPHSSDIFIQCTPFTGTFMSSVVGPMLGLLG